ncbi:protein SPT2 homolog [Anopheles ziemanni]|uniref:protein SPT2 homolog n=1 Tax=Anopheles coustani TaxID=139045 RepID=UPI002658619E|nr:protein SPT2 homolog [Anopheles coustani]XP_058175573.1 protein SPT2 homolog [Anopheles ziemanni]
MDFGKLLSVAKRNTCDGGQNGEGRYYSTKFAPPKKENKEKKLSENIKKFLAKKEAEERAKALETRRKADEMMAKRDVKAQRKIEKMLKVIKSANKSVLDDATDAQSTAITQAGPEQPDEDDYGYTSNVASQFYQQLMDKYKSNPEEQKFKEAERRTMSKEDLARTKARVKDAIVRQTEEEHGPRSRKSRIGGTAGDERDAGGRCARGPDPYDPVEEQKRREAEAARVKAEEKKKAPIRKSSGVPPPPDFATLLKLAEQKQKEPIRMESDPVPEKRRSEPERLMTKREKKEHDERMAFFEMKRLRDRIRDDPKLSEKEKQQRLAKLEAMRAAGKLPGIPPASGVESASARVTASPAAKSATSTSNGVVPTPKPSPSSVSSAVPRSGAILGKQTDQQQTLGKIKKRTEPGTDPSLAKKSTSSVARPPASAGGTSNTPLSSSQSSKPRQQSGAPAKVLAGNAGMNERHPVASSSTTVATSKSTPKPSASSSNGHIQRSKLHQTSSTSASSKVTSSSVSSTITASGAKASTLPKQSANARSSSSSTGAIGSAVKREDPVKTTANRSAVSSGSTRRPPTEPVTQTRQFPPPDVQRSLKRPAMRPNGAGTGQSRPSGHSSSSSVGKKRRVIDSDSEYDSEMDDFIDDGDCEEDYSSAIKEIFGYDKSRYRDEYYDDDDYNMESSYAQQMREEYISKRIGIMEDLEDMRMEEEEKRRKLGKKGPATGAKKK